MKHLKIEKVIALQFVLVFYDIRSLAASTEPPTASKTSAPESQIYARTAPWGDHQTRSIELGCDIDIPEEIGPGDLIIMLSLNRSTTNVNPHTLDLVQGLPDGLRFTFTNAWIVPVGPFEFDFELSYSVDGNETYIPGGYCSRSSVSATTTSVTTNLPTTTTTTTISTVPTTVVSTTTSTVPTTVVSTTTSTVPTTVVSTTTSTVPTTVVSTTTSTVPTTVVSTTTSTVPTTVVSTTTSTISTTGISTKTSTIPTTIVSTTSAAATTEVTKTTLTTVSMTTSLAPTTTASTALTTRPTQTTLTSTSSNEGEASRGNIFTNVRYGDLVSVIFVATLSVGCLAILGICRCCLYKYAFRRGAVGSEDDIDNTRASRNTTPVSSLQPSSPVSTSSVTSLIFV